MTNKKKKIIIFSGKQYSGKDTVAKIIIEKYKNFKRIGIADSIKLKYSEQTGLSLSEIEKNKSQYRQDLINLGNWGRAQNPDYWLDSIIEYKGDTIVTDIRMKHELNKFKAQGAFCVRVEAKEDIREKRGKLTSSKDTTETQLDKITNWDYIINNNGSYEELLDNVKPLLLKIDEYINLD